MTLDPSIMSRLLKDPALCLPLWEPTIHGREDLDARGLQLPLVVVWGVHDQGQDLGMKVSVNAVRLDAELRRLLPSKVAPQQYEEMLDLAESAIAVYARSIMEDLVAKGLPVPLCLERDARAAMLAAGPLSDGGARQLA